MTLSYLDPFKQLNMYKICLYFLKEHNFDSFSDTYNHLYCFFDPVQAKMAWVEVDII